MRSALIVLWVLGCWVTSATAQVSIGIGLPGVSIGINMPTYPGLVAVPGYPVYYDPQASSNFFFYDGMYWVYQGDNWYASSWYNGPWGLVSPEAVPYFILRVPVRYYRHPPAYFRGWTSNAPPRWGEHWGNTWARSRPGWDKWDRSSVPAPAPLPTYQRQYSGNKYPRLEQQQAIQSQNYRYQPREAVVKQHYQAQEVQSPRTQQNVQQQERQQQQQQQAATQQKAQQQKQQESGTQQKAQQQERQQQQPQQAAQREQNAQRQAPARQGPEKAEQQGGEKAR